MYYKNTQDSPHSIKGLIAVHYVLNKLSATRINTAIDIHQIALTFSILSLGIIKTCFMKKIILLICSIVWSAVGHTQDCPNGDFENWASYPYSVPDSGWYNSDAVSVYMADTLTVWPVAGVVGEAVHIETAIIGTDTLQAYITQGDPGTGWGGVPYTQQPTAITGYYRYHLVGNDSAMLLVMFKKAGVVVSANWIKIRNSSGAISTFTPFSYPISVSVVPDSVIVAAASSNIQGTGLQSGSWLELDELAFAGTGITQPISGGSFDLWNTQNLTSPMGWQMQGNSGFMGSGLTRSTLHISGNYSLELTTLSGGGHGGVNNAMATTGYMPPNSGPRGGLPYTHRTDTIDGYYQYVPVGTDTGQIYVSLYAGGSQIGGNIYNFFATTGWTYFELPFSVGTTPDTMRIDIQSGSWAAALPGSVLNIDYLELKSQPLPPLSIFEVNGDFYNPVVYPNPAEDYLNFRFQHHLSGPCLLYTSDAADE